MHYENGIGVEKDEMIAIEIYRKLSVGRGSKKSLYAQNMLRRHESPLPE